MIRGLMMVAGALADVVDEDPPLHADLIGRQARPGRGVHRLDHGVDQARDGAVDLLDLAGALLSTGSPYWRMVRLAMHPILPGPLN